MCGTGCDFKVQDILYLFSDFDISKSKKPAHDSYTRRLRVVIGGSYTALFASRRGLVFKGVLHYRV